MKLAKPRPNRYLQSKEPCPFCNGHRWRAFGYRLSPLLFEGAALIDHVGPATVGIDECAGCGAVLCGVRVRPRIAFIKRPLQA